MDREWISCTAISKMLGLSYRGVRGLVDAGLLGERSILGARRLYSARDAEKIEHFYTRVATFEGAEPGALVVNGSPVPMPRRRPGRPREVAAATA